MTIKVIKEKSRCNSCLAKKSGSLKLKHNDINHKLFM